jgi:hypothetical protein
VSHLRILVLLRTFGDRPAIVVIREFKGDVPIICRPELADAIDAGDLNVPPIGGRREDLFELDEETAARVRAGEPIEWDRLRHAQLP